MRKFVLVSLMAILVTLSTTTIHAQTQQPGVYNRTPGFLNVCNGPWCGPIVCVVPPGSPRGDMLIFSIVDTMGRPYHMFDISCVRCPNYWDWKDGHRYSAAWDYPCNGPLYTVVHVVPPNETVDYCARATHPCVQTKVGKIVNGSLVPSNVFPISAVIGPPRDCVGNTYPFNYGVGICAGHGSGCVSPLNTGVGYHYEIIPIEVPPLAYLTEGYVEIEPTALQKQSHQQTTEGQEHNFIEDTGYELGVKIRVKTMRITVWYRQYICKVTEQPSGTITYNCKHGQPLKVDVPNPLYTLRIERAHLAHLVAGPISPIRDGNVFTVNPIFWNFENARGAGVYSQRRAPLSGLFNIGRPSSVNYMVLVTAAGQATLPRAFCTEQNGVLNCKDGVGDYRYEATFGFGFPIRIHSQTRSR